MHVLLTGATGFIGPSLVEVLLDAGHRCCVLSHRPGRAREVLPEAANVLTYHDNWPEIDVMVNMAGESAAGLWTPEKRQRIKKSRIQVTHRLVEWIRIAPRRPSALISISGIGIYGHRPGEVLTEASAPDPEGKFRAEVVKTWEAQAKLAEGLGVRVALVRLANVLHPDGGYLDGLLRVYRRLPFVIGLGNGDNGFSWIGRHDALRFLLFLLENEEAHGVFNASSPNPVTREKLTRLLAQQLDKPAFGRIPDLVLRVGLGEFASALIDSQRVLPERAQALGFAFEEPQLAPYLESVL